MAKVDPQKSEVHDSTDDAGSSPASTGERPDGSAKLHAPHGKVRPSDVHLNQAHVVRDDSDDGGPLVIESDDPGLKSPKPPVDPFPTDGTPEIDPPVEK